MIRLASIYTAVISNAVLIAVSVAILVFLLYPEQNTPEFLFPPYHSHRNHHMSKSSSKHKTGGIFAPSVQAQSVENHIKYAVVLDAGSTGTRIHAYAFSFHDGVPTSLQDELFTEVPIGMATLCDRPESVGEEILDPLIRQALEYIPSQDVPNTMISLRATAGFRLLPKEKSAKLLNATKSCIEKYPFIMADHNGISAVSIIDGREEAIWGWISMNFLLKRIGYEHSIPSSVIDTVAVLDLGGASTQIVFEIDQEDYLYYQDLILEKDYFYTMKFGSRNYTLFQHSFLGYGLMEARKQIKRNFMERNNSFDLENPAKLPCLPTNYCESIHYHSMDEQYNKIGSLWLNGSENMDAYHCKQCIERVFAFESPCSKPPCSFSGVPLPRSFKSMPAIYGSSYIYDRLNPLLSYHVNSTSTIDMSTMWKFAQYSCGYTVINEPITNFNMNISLFQSMINKDAHFCMDLVYIYTLLKDAYGIEDDKLLNIIKKIDGIEAAWTLGAALEMILE